MVEQVTFLTEEGLKKIEQELDMLRNVRRPQVIKQLQDALEQASTLENPDYEIAKNEQSFVEGRILQLEQIIKNVVIIEPHPVRGVVELGCRVTITEGMDGEPEQYIVVGSPEADPSRGYISNESPLGRALLGRRVNDQIKINAPDGPIIFYVRAIE